MPNVVAAVAIIKNLSLQEKFRDERESIVGEELAKKK